MAGDVDAGSTYSTPVSVPFLRLKVFLAAFLQHIPTLPASLQAIIFNSANQLVLKIITVVMLLIMAFLAYITITFIIEALSVANAIQAKNTESMPLIPGADSVNAHDGLMASSAQLQMGGLQLDITRRIEMGKLAEMFLGTVGKYLFYLIIILYLFGDLAIYATSVPQSLQKVFGGWTSSDGVELLSCHNSFYVYLGFFTVVVVPFAFFNFQKTKYLQFATMAIRNISLFTMIILSIIRLAKNGTPPGEVVPLADFAHFPSFFGVTIYAFMCHHSLPAIVAPIENKSRLKQVIGGDVISIFFVYTLLCITGLYSFGQSLNPLYTFNFADQWRPLAMFLELFPVFTLSSNFPLIAITLRNNIITLLRSIIGEERCTTHPIFRKGRERLAEVMFSLIAVLPALGIAAAVDNVSLLVKITGSYPGLGIMFVAPTLMVFFARRKLKTEHDYPEPGNNPLSSPFQSLFWIILIGVWCLAAIALVTYNLATSTTSLVDVCDVNSTIGGH